MIFYTNVCKLHPYIASYGSSYLLECAKKQRNLNVLSVLLVKKDAFSVQEKWKKSVQIQKKINF